MALIQTVGDQAASNYAKNRGNPGQWFAHTADYREPQPNPRVRPEAQDFAQKNKPTVGEVFHNYRLQPDSEAAPVRLRDGDAKRIADKFQNQEDKWFDFQGNYAFHPKQRQPKIYPPSNLEVAEKVNQTRGGEWYAPQQQQVQQQRPQSRCTSREGKEIAANMRAQSNWFRHESRPQTAPSPANSRVRGGDANEFLERNQQGTAAGWMMAHSSQGDPMAVYGNRCPTTSAQENLDAARGQQMRECFGRGSSGAPQPQAVGPKVKGDLAQEVAQRNQRGAMQTLGPKATEQKVVRKTRPEAEAFLEQAKGQLGSVMDQSANKGYASARPQPRVKTGLASEVADKNRGVMGSCLNDTDYRPPPKDHKTHERPNKSDVAKEVAIKSSGDAVKQLVNSSSLAGEPQRKGKTLSAGAEDTAARNRGCAGLVITGAAPPSARAPAARVRPEAAGTAEKYRGSGFFKTIQMRPPSGR